MGKLSKTQQKRLGGLLAINESEPTEEIVNLLVQEKFIEKINNKYVVTNKGKQEKKRLTILAGLMFEKN